MMQSSSSDHFQSNFVHIKGSRMSKQIRSTLTSLNLSSLSYLIENMKKYNGGKHCERPDAHKSELEYHRSISKEVDL